MTLATPSRATILIAACRAAEAGPARAVLSGVVRDGSGGQAIPGAVVRVEWRDAERVARADEEGRYAVCGVPAGESVAVRAAFLGRRGDAVELAVGDGGHEALDLVIDLPPGVLAADAAVAAGAAVVAGDVAGGRGAQGIQGRVVEHGSGRAVRAAEVRLLSGSGAVLATVATDERGFFRLRVPRSGRYLLSARALGYGDVEGEAVEVEPDRLSVLEVTMAAEALEMEPIVAAVERRSFHLEMEGFYRREREGFGVFMRPELLEERRPRRVTDLFFGVGGTRVIQPSGGVGGQIVVFRAARESRDLGDRLDLCLPMVYVDRHLVSTGGLLSAGAEPTAIDDVVFAADVLAIEVFRSPAEIPSEFHGPNAGCGVVVLWTRRGGGG